MSSHYSAGQFDAPFLPRRLRNWEQGTITKYRIKQHRRLSPTKFIANEKGHLLPEVPRNACTSPWGNLDVNTWQKEHSPSSISNSNLQQRSCGKHRISRFFKKKLPLKIPTLSPVDARSFPDPILSHLRELQLPVIWIIGLPTKKIVDVRRKFCKQLSATLEFCYIHLDEQVEKWQKRCKLSEPLEKPGSNSVSISTNSSRQRQYTNKSLGYQPRPSVKPLEHRKNTYALRTNVELILPEELKTFKANQIVQDSLKTLSDQEGQREIKDEENNKITINFNLSSVFVNDKVLELIKFAMIEGLPTKGFILEGFPYNQKEAFAFEKMLYPSALGIYFSEGNGNQPEKSDGCGKNNSILRQPNQRSNNGKKREVVRKCKVMSSSLLPSDYSEIGSRLQAKPVPVCPKYVRRFLPYSFIEVEKVCENYGHKVIRIINAEDVQLDMMGFLNSLIFKTLNKYPDILEGNTKINYETSYENTEASLISAVTSPGPITTTNTPDTFSCPSVHNDNTLSSGKRTCSIVKPQSNRFTFKQRDTFIKSTKPQNISFPISPPFTVSSSTMTEIEAPSTSHSIQSNNITDWNAQIEDEKDSKSVKTSNDAFQLEKEEDNQSQSKKESLSNESLSEIFENKGDEDYQSIRTIDRHIHIPLSSWIPWKSCDKKYNTDYSKSPSSSSCEIESSSSDKQHVTRFLDDKTAMKETYSSSEEITDDCTFKTTYCRSSSNRHNIPHETSSFVTPQLELQTVNDEEYFDDFSTGISAVTLDKITDMEVRWIDQSSDDEVLTEPQSAQIMNISSGFTHAKEDEFDLFSQGDTSGIRPNMLEVEVQSNDFITPSQTGQCSIYVYSSIPRKI